MIAQRHLLTLTVGVMMFAAGAVTMHFWPTPSEAVVDEFKHMRPFREQSHAYDFIDPLLTCIFPESVELPECSHLEADVEKLIRQHQVDGKITRAAYYFRDLNEGRWVGVHEDDAFEPASLFKVPVMMAYLFGAEAEPELLDRKVPFVASSSNSDSASSLLRDGQVYSFQELIDIMITESDNAALNTLLAYLNEDILRELFGDLSIPYPEAETGDPYTISPRLYSYFFRVLYNGTYLSPVMSERALALMSQATFVHGIALGLPDDVRVSHKFGERRLTNEDGQTTGYELHDCGIVYYPEHAYFLCIFTQGEELEPLTQTLGDLSALTYAEMQTLYPETE